MEILSFALLSFATYGDARLLEFASSVIAALTGNKYFTNIASHLARAKDALDAFARALEEARRGSGTQIATKNVAKKVLVQSLKDLCNAVNFEQRGNRPALESSKFQISKPNRQPVKVTPLESVKLVPGEASGEIIIKVKKGDGAVALRYDYTLDAEITLTTVWLTINSTESTYTFTNLPVGKFLTVRAAAVGARNQTVYSNPVKRMVA